ncbi:hypothetical protein [Luteibacter sp. UNCMF366Tsu5.1]|uniref:hypothetical protein n=1 Tax=Luteibacter sp. UNCMF366Tsu5.1 TaxID=1502758 RepID=UPI0009090BB5|nr:hypothetical protein [Luteibacter sp. UNCMF366Tsu5.1]SFW28267.1 hypothetical protein SAMN02800691_0755 [Luteibacter sp. UNCMF366Tsu5.1]
MIEDDAVLDAADLLLDAVALSEALLDGDLSEARFRARPLATKASAAGYAEVHAAAVQVVDLLGLPGHRPQAGYAAAVVTSSATVEQAAAFLRG